MGGAGPMGGSYYGRGDQYGGRPERYGVEPRPGQQGQPGRPEHDHDYRSWRDRQMQQFDRDYQEFRQHRQDRFNEEFEAWRRNRQMTAGQESNAQIGTTQRAPSGGEDERTASGASPSMKSGEPKK